MVVNRWQAESAPSKSLIKLMLESEGLEPVEETFDVSAKIPEHRHPFYEIRIVVEGELLVNIAGNQFLLRKGDRVEIPSNTKHSYSTQGKEACLCVFAVRLI